MEKLLALFFVCGLLAVQGKVNTRVAQIALHLNTPTTKPMDFSHELATLGAPIGVVLPLPINEKAYVHPAKATVTVCDTTKPLDASLKGIVQLKPFNEKILEELKKNPAILQVLGPDYETDSRYINYDAVMKSVGLSKKKTVFWSNAARTIPPATAAMSGEDVARQYGSNHDFISLEMVIDQTGLRMPMVQDIAPDFKPLLDSISSKKLQAGTQAFRDEVKAAFKTYGPKGSKDEAYLKAQSDAAYKAKCAPIDKIWNDISEALARHCSGDVKALLGADIVKAVKDGNINEKGTNIFTKTEYNRIITNKEVKTLTALDPMTYVETNLYTKK